jgi:hypothetical protein
LIADNKYRQIIPDLFKNIFYEKIETTGKQTGLSCYQVSCKHAFFHIYPKKPSV